MFPDMLSQLVELHFKAFHINNNNQQQSQESSARTKYILQSFNAIKSDRQQKQMIWDDDEIQKSLKSIKQEYD